VATVGTSNTGGLKGRTISLQAAVHPGHMLRVPGDEEVLTEILITASSEGSNNSTHILGLLSFRTLSIFQVPHKKYNISISVVMLKRLVTHSDGSDRNN
jgi:hypothetical protein